MKINIHTAGNYQVVQMEEDLNVISDLDELYFLVDGYANRGKYRIAVSFPNASYVYSGAIAVLLKCAKRIKESGGDLAILEPSADVRNIFNVLMLTKVISLYDSEEELKSL